MELISWAGAVLLAVCAVPLSWEAIKHNKADIQTPFLILWFTGEALMAVYAVSLKDIALIFNYAANVILLLPVVVVKWRRTNEN